VLYRDLVIYPYRDLVYYPVEFMTTVMQ